LADWLEETEAFGAADFGRDYEGVVVERLKVVESGD
jgi:hypothetical protein